ncbi:hypothetical protein FHT29_005964 [Rhizobium sp. SG741]|nr:hypothetical protein [Rhizobium sp. SG741]
MKEANCNRLHVFISEALDRGRDIGLVERRKFDPAGTKSLLHRDTQGAVDQRGRQFEEEVEEVEAEFKPDLDRVAKTGSGDHCGFCAFALDQRVRRKRGPVHHQIEFAIPNARLIENQIHGSQNAVVRVLVGGQAFGGVSGAVNLQRCVSKCAPDIDAKARASFALRKFSVRHPFHS